MTFCWPGLLHRAVGRGQKVGSLWNASLRIKYETGLTLGRPVRGRRGQPAFLGARDKMRPPCCKIQGLCLSPPLPPAIGHSQPRGSRPPPSLFLFVVSRTTILTCCLLSSWLLRISCLCRPLLLFWTTPWRTAGTSTPVPFSPYTHSMLELILYDDFTFFLFFIFFLSFCLF